eukprot:TRINITY_DN24629_c0_g1_i2.p2 TRINITY_DN24629_c0_g1~~TRINITY_DN24629_c0_g1_i2.p2  ORF type:complete len:283 (-),score=17.86 TRINITY_DN24629_c0_g1_i2:68-916(-)
MKMVCKQFLNIDIYLEAVQVNYVINTCVNKAIYIPVIIITKTIITIIMLYNHCEILCEKCEQWPDFGCEGIKVQRAHQPTSQCQGKKKKEISFMLTETDDLQQVIQNPVFEQSGNQQNSSLNLALNTVVQDEDVSQVLGKVLDKVGQNNQQMEDGQIFQQNQSSDIQNLNAVQDTVLEGQEQETQVGGGQNQNSNQVSNDQDLNGFQNLVTNATLLPKYKILLLIRILLLQLKSKRIYNKIKFWEIKLLDLMIKCYKNPLLSKIGIWLNKSQSQIGLWAPST